MRGEGQSGARPVGAEGTAASPLGGEESGAGRDRGERAEGGAWAMPVTATERRRRPRARGGGRGRAGRGGGGASGEARRVSAECAMRGAGRQLPPVPRGHPAYRYMRDGDGDGVVCE